MGRILRTYCHAENVGNHVAHYVSEYVHSYDSRCSELDVQPFLQAYYKGHGHRQYGKEQFVLYTCKPAQKSYGCMQQREKMYDYACTDVFHGLFPVSGQPDFS